MFNLRCILLGAILVPAFAAPTHRKPVRIAAAADLQPVLPALAAAFQKTTGTSVDVSYASSSTLATQILNGAPYDLFLAANTAFPQRVVDAGLSIQSRPVLYARGMLVLWVRHGVVAGPPSIQTLTSPSVHRIAVADPQHAPYGAAAMAALHSSGLFAVLQPKLVYAENIAQAAQFAQSGNAQCALISKTLAISPPLQRAGDFVELAAGSYPPLQQAAVVLRNASEQPAADAFLQYLLSPAGRELLVKGGLSAPAPAP